MAALERPLPGRARLLSGVAAAITLGGAGSYAVCASRPDTSSTSTLLANATEPATAAQRQTAVGLAVTHVGAEFRRFPQVALPGVDFDHPQVLARRAASGRRLIFVIFDSELPNWGEYVVFEVCAHLARIVRIDSGKLSDVELYRRIVTTIDVSTPSQLPSGCQSARG
jgi:hypothetical protein